MSSPPAREQEGFLRDFHRRHAGVTPRGLVAGRVPGGGSSYDAVARRVGGGARVVDLGCGDGVLLAALIAAGGDGARMIGVDLSEAELAAARRRLGGAVNLVQARAQALPLRDGVVDVVVSHLAFTLMAEPEVVAGEIARVLAPGGRFVAVVGGGPRGDDAFAGLLELAQPALRAAAAAGRGVPRLGEVRARGERGLRAMFAAAHGWARLELRDLPVDLSGSPDDVWARLGAVAGYELDGVGEAERERLRRGFLATCGRWQRADGQVACTMATTLVEAVRGTAAGAA